MKLSSVPYTNINGRTYGYIGWKHSGIQSRIHLAEGSRAPGESQTTIYAGAPTLCGGRVTDDPDDTVTSVGRPCGNCNRKAGTGKVRQTGIDEIVRHAQAKSTGATITVTRVGPGSVYEQDPGWMTMCLNHGMLVFHDTRILAVRHSSEPEGWCESCANLYSDIVHGRADKLKGKLR